MTAKDSPAIAVLIPVYNADRWLERALASLTLNREPHDVVIVDDGSGKPVHEWLPAHPNVCVLTLERNSGIVAALNHGLQYILDRGYTYVARMDADDEAMPDRLFQQREFLDAHSDVAAVGTCAEVVTDTGELVFHLNHPTDHAGIVSKMRDICCFVHPSLMFRAEVFRRVGSYRQGYPSAEDYELLLRIMQTDRLANLPEYLLRYTQNSAGISVTTRRAQLMSRLRLQWKYRDLDCAGFYYGILRTLALLTLPVRLLTAMKSRSRQFKRQPSILAESRPV